jgi:hypothetical protein
MAGSVKYFKYTSDDGTDYALRMDESNGEAIGNADLGVLDTGLINEIPKNLEPRYALYRNLATGYQRKIVVCDRTANASTLPATLTLKTDSGDVSFWLSYYRGEAYRRVPTSVDTGIDDGDIT